jgi:hypothetical protein
LPNESGSRIIIDPLDDALLLAGRKYLEYVARGTAEQKSKQYAIFEELLEDRLEHGDSFPFPKDVDIPTEQLLNSDTLTESQTIKLIGSILRELEARRHARYSY